MLSLVNSKLYLQASFLQLHSLIVDSVIFSPVFFFNGCDRFFPADLWSLYYIFLHFIWPRVYTTGFCLPHLKVSFNSMLNCMQRKRISTQVLHKWPFFPCRTLVIILYFLAFYLTACIPGFCLPRLKVSFNSMLNCMQRKRISTQVLQGHGALCN